MSSSTTSAAFRSNTRRARNRSTAISGFILLGFLAADRGGAPLDELFEQIVRRVSAAPTGSSRTLRTCWRSAFRSRRATGPRRPSRWPEDVRRGRRLVGEVHDNYAAALGGVAGHAGLFGTAAGVGGFARAMLARRPRRRSHCRRRLSPALGQTRDTGRRPCPAAHARSAGTRCSRPRRAGRSSRRSAFGHVGFTGTSLWIDPPRDRYYVLLTNRVCGGGTEADIKEVRRAFHDALAAV